VIDLHVHTDRSDGTDSPARVAELAAAAGCRSIAITDHDRLDGVEPARTRAQTLGVDVVGGCETSCRAATGTLHLLAYFVEDGDGPLQDELAELRQWRQERNTMLADRLADLGLPVTLEDMQEEAGGQGVGRPHAAAVLVRKGVAGSVQEAFDTWLGDGKPGYVEGRRPAPDRVIGLVRASGGVAVLAHPLSLGLAWPDLDRAVGELARLGLSGLEAIYGRYSEDERTRLTALAKAHDLVATGGSDYHGAYKPDLRLGTGHGDLHVPEAVLTDLAARRP
jgi:predicted metal-dependent phosphoesterase TrpH